MKKQLTTGSLLLASVGALSAQGLYDIAPDYRATESTPIKWSAGASLGWDDNVSPSRNNNDEVYYAHVYVGAAFRHLTPQTTHDFYATLGGRVYLEEPEGSGNDLVAQSKLSYNIKHNVNARLRLVSNNYLGYESEPDYENGIGAEGSEYFHYSSRNAVGYRWTERLGTYTGFGVNGVDYSDNNSANDRMGFSVFNDFRYNLSPQTVVKFGYEYSWRESSGSARDSENQIITLGLERRINENTSFSARAGVQLRDVQGGKSSSRPYVEAALRTQVNEQFGIRSFVKYSTEDYGTSLGNVRYDNNNALRFGVTADYRVSPVLMLNGGVNYIVTDFEDGSNRLTNASVADADQDILNLFVGFSYELNDGVFFTGTYNWTQGGSSSSARPDYNRNRASLGMRVSF